MGTVTDSPRAAARGASRASEKHPLLGGFPLTVMSLATFLVLFTLMMARLTAGADPALVSSANAGLVAKGSRGSVIRSRTSGGAVPVATAAPVQARQAGASREAIITRASGAGVTGSGDD